MEVLQERIANVKKPKEGRAYCISHVYVDGVYSHDIIEDEDRGLSSDQSLETIAKIKVMHKTAIPTGDYTVKMNVVSSTFSKKAYYMQTCKGKLPRLDPVKGFAGILMHCGSNETHSSGCLIVGMNKKVGEVTDTKDVFERLLKLFNEAAARGETIHYRIRRKYTVK